MIQEEIRDLIATTCCGWKIWDKYPDLYVQVNDEGCARGYVSREKFVPWKDANQAADACTHWVEKHGGYFSHFLDEVSHKIQYAKGNTYAERLAWAMVQQFLEEYESNLSKGKA